MIIAKSLIIKSAKIPAIELLRQRFKSLPWLSLREPTFFGGCDIGLVKAFQQINEK